MMTELRRLRYLLDANDIHVRPRFIRSAANVWADTLSRELDIEDWQLYPKIVSLLQDKWGRHFASMLNT
jgi:hemerythrin-like domain-containing protein